MTGPDSIQKIEFDKDPASLDDRDLVYSHALLHRYWSIKGNTGKVEIGGKPRSNEDLINYHALLMEEMKRRSYLHHDQDELDERTADLLGEDGGEGDEEGEEEGGAEVMKARAPFSSAAGKGRVALRLVSMIPSHRLYIEPFCGSGAVLFAKEPSADEVICDADPEVAFSLNFIKAATDPMIEELRSRFNWIGSRARFMEVKALEPRDELERFYRFRYLRLHSFGSNMKSWAPDQDGTDFHGWARMRSARSRLARVEILEGDGVAVMLERSAPDSFAYLDPPYWNTANTAVEGKRFDAARFRTALSTMRGKWLLTLMSEASEIAAPFRRRVFFRHNSRNWNAGSTQAMRSEMVLANYDPDDIEKSLDLSPFAPEREEEPGRSGDGKETVVKADPFLENPEEGPAGWRYVVQHHYRGETVHADLRIEGSGKTHLIGWTIADMIPGSIDGSADEEARKRIGLDPGEPVPEDRRDDWLDLVFQIAQERDKARGGFKVDWSTGEFARRRTGSGNVVPAELRAFQKTRSPVAWLDVEGVTPAFPAPGATRQYRGIFTILDGSPKDENARAEYGRQSSYFHEYFFKGGKLRGRFVFRQLAREGLAAEKGLLVGKIADPELGIVKVRILPASLPDEGEPEDLLWVAIQPLDQTPYYISRRAVDQEHYPPALTSGLPWALRNAIPQSFRYWEEKDQSRAHARRDELVDAIERGEVELDLERLVAGRESKVRKAAGRFVLSHQWFKGSKSGREGSTAEHWDLWIDAGDSPSLEHWKTTESPIDNYELSAIMRKDRDKSGLSFEGEAAPGTPLNPTKDTPSFVERLDEGEITILEDGDLMRKWRIEGEALNGTWTAERPGTTEYTWTLKRVDGDGAE